MKTFVVFVSGRGEGIVLKAARWANEHHLYSFYDEQYNIVGMFPEHVLIGIIEQVT